MLVIRKSELKKKGNLGNLIKAFRFWRIFNNPMEKRGQIMDRNSLWMMSVVAKA